jgi:hypothetical protein
MTHGRMTILIAVSKNKEVDRVPAALVPVVDLSRVAVNASERCIEPRDRDAATNVAARPSLGSRDLAAMVMSDLDRETL